jgi:PIN domain nuclease of toxin-antitoxin system
MIVLDTHAWLWWVSDPARLSPRARAAIDTADAIGVSAASCWEVATLERLGRIALDRDVREWVGAALAMKQVQPLPVTAEDAVAAGRLASTFGGDPADRMIYATAQRRSAKLITRDDGLRQFDPGGTIW